MTLEEKIKGVYKKVDTRNKCPMEYKAALEHEQIKDIYSFCEKTGYDGHSSNEKYYTEKCRKCWQQEA